MTSLSLSLLRELSFEPKEPIKICDSKVEIDIAENPVQHDRTKYVQVDRHLIKEKIQVE